MNWASFSDRGRELDANSIDFSPSHGAPRVVPAYVDMDLLTFTVGFLHLDLGAVLRNIDYHAWTAIDGRANAGKNAAFNTFADS
jgi:hypothetical protein